MLVSPHKPDTRCDGVVRCLPAVPPCGRRTKSGKPARGKIEADLHIGCASLPLRLAVTPTSADRSTLADHSLDSTGRVVEHPGVVVLDFPTFRPPRWGPLVFPAQSALTPIAATPICAPIPDSGRFDLGGRMTQHDGARHLGLTSTFGPQLGGRLFSPTPVRGSGRSAPPPSCARDPEPSDLSRHWSPARHLPEIMRPLRSGLADRPPGPSYWSSASSSSPSIFVRRLSILA